MQELAMKFEDLAMTIPGAATGIYIAHPTTEILKPTYRGHKTQVNHLHTKIGITTKSFVKRENEYMRTFQYEVAFYPILIATPEVLAALETGVLQELLTCYSKSGSAKEWFFTTERQAIAELVWKIADSSPTR